VQLAEYEPEAAPPVPDGMPAPVGAPAALRTVDFAVADADRVVALLAGLLGGQRSDDGPDGVGVTWPAIGTTLRPRPAGTPTRLAFAGVARPRPDGRDPVLGVDLSLAS
jgi:hypothetical protein